MKTQVLTSSNGEIAKKTIGDRVMLFSIFSTLFFVVILAYKTIPDYNLTSPEIYSICIGMYLSLINFTLVCLVAPKSPEETLSDTGGLYFFLVVLLLVYTILFSGALGIIH